MRVQLFCVLLGGEITECVFENAVKFLVSHSIGETWGTYQANLTLKARYDLHCVESAVKLQPTKPTTDQAEMWHGTANH